MTYSLSAGARAFLAERQFSRVAEVVADRKIVPRESGIYGWWFDAALLPEMREGVATEGAWRLLYVGIAPSAAQKEGKPRTLQDRLSNHCRGPIATSTLRRSIVALIRSQEGLGVERRPTGKVCMPAAHETKLTKWMDTHARLTWMTIRAPWDLENEMLKGGPRLPLNILGSTDPYRHELKKLRADADEAADLPDPRRFQADAADIKMIPGKVVTIDLTTEEQRKQNEEHDRIVYGTDD